MRIAPVVAIGCALGCALSAQPKRILYVTHSAGFRHDSLPVSAEAMRTVAAASGRLEVVATEDVSMLNAATLRGYDAVFFFTSGELPIGDQQKRDLLDFVRSGKGFGGAHSATDTFYNWPEYGEMIGGYFNGHPWVQEVGVFVESNHPAVASIPPGFRILEEIYQFRSFSRERVRVLLSLNPRTVDLKAPGVNPNTDDFPLAWVRNYGSGRVFYTALGHFSETWRDVRFQGMLSGAMLWLTGQIDGDATPQPQRPPLLANSDVSEAAGFAHWGTVSPGSIISIFGLNLITGATSAAPDPRNPPIELAGTSVSLSSIYSNKALPLFYASPTQINAYVPMDVHPQTICMAIGGCLIGQYYTLGLRNAAGSPATLLRHATTTPGIFAVTANRSWVTVWGTGFGPVERRESLDWTAATPSVTIGGAAARVQFSGLAPGWPGLYQVNIAVPPSTVFPARMDFALDGWTSSTTLNPAE